MLFGSLGTPEILMILFVVLLLFGAKKLPEMARGMGRAVNEFRRGTSDLVSEFQNADRDLRDGLRVGSTPTSQPAASAPAPAPTPEPEAPAETQETAAGSTGEPA